MSTELFEAIDRHDLSAINKLLAQGASVEEKQEAWPYWRPIEAAVEELNTGGAVDVVKALIEAGADVNGWDVDQSLTPLHSAVYADNIEALGLLLQAGADPTIVTDEGDTALKYVSENRQLDAARLLLQHGAARNINQRGGPTGMTALHFAIRNLDEAMTTLLIDAGADPE